MNNNKYTVITLWNNGEYFTNNYNNEEDAIDLAYCECDNPADVVNSIFICYPDGSIKKYI